MLINTVIFSKDRAMQLDATLRSFFLHCQDADEAEISVLYLITDERHARQYQTLMANYPQVTFIKQRDFRKDVLSILGPSRHGSVQDWLYHNLTSSVRIRLRKGASVATGWRGSVERIIFFTLQKILPVIHKSEYILFLVDDNLFVRDFRFSDAKTSLESTPCAIGFSLRLGMNTTYCYALNQPQLTPSFSTLSENILRFNWINAEYDFNYPLELSSSIYSTAVLLPLIAGLDFRNPNELEAQMASHGWLLRNKYPFLCCYSKSVTFCNPVNIVQSSFSNRSGGHSLYSVENLTSRFDQGERIKVEAYTNHTPNACHEEVELIFTKEKGRAFTND